MEYWSGWPFSSPGALPNPGIKPASLVSPALAGGSLNAFHAILSLFKPLYGFTSGSDSKESMPPVWLLMANNSDLPPHPRIYGSSTEFSFQCVIKYAPCT